MINKNDRVLIVMGKNHEHKELTKALRLMGVPKDAIKMVSVGGSVKDIRIPDEHGRLERPNALVMSGIPGEEYRAYESWMHNKLMPAMAPNWKNVRWG